MIVNVNGALNEKNVNDYKLSTKEKFVNLFRFGWFPITLIIPAAAAPGSNLCI